MKTIGNETRSPGNTSKLPRRRGTLRLPLRMRTSKAQDAVPLPKGRLYSELAPLRPIAGGVAGVEARYVVLGEAGGRAELAMRGSAMPAALSRQVQTVQA